jgi:hypothetical protein
MTQTTPETPTPPAFSIVDALRTLVSAHPWFTEAEARAAAAAVERDGAALLSLLGYVAADPAVDAAALALVDQLVAPAPAAVPAPVVDVPAVPTVEQPAAVAPLPGTELLAPEPPAAVAELPSSAPVDAGTPVVDPGPVDLPTPTEPAPVDAAPVDAPAPVDVAPIPAPTSAPDAGTADVAPVAVPAFVEPGAVVDAPAPSSDVTA